MLVHGWLTDSKVADGYPAEFIADLPKLRHWLYTCVLGEDTSYSQASDALIIYFTRIEGENKPLYTICQVYP